MGNTVNEPAAIQAIYERPGRQWTAAEKQRVKEWLLASEQLGALLHFALYNLGEGVSAEDAEDTCAVLLAHRLDALINLYDPTRGRRFWNYLLFCLERECWRDGDKLRQRRWREPSLDVEVDLGDGNSLALEWRFAVSEMNPEAAVEKVELWLALQHCLETLPPAFYQLVIRHYFDEEPLAKISVTLGLSEINVKVRLYRARQKLAECLAAEGESR